MVKIAFGPSALLVCLLAFAPFSASSMEPSEEPLECDDVEAGASSLEAAAEASDSADEAEEDGGGGGGMTRDRAPLLTLETDGGFDLAVGGYLRSTLSYIDYDEAESDFIGRNQGFGMASARIGIEGRRDRAHFVLEIDGVVARMDASNTSEGRVTTSVADAYAGYDVLPGVMRVDLGQQKVPFDGETLISTAELPFIRNSVWQRGVQGVEGFNVEGMGIDREVGLTLSGERIEVGAGPFSMSYWASLTNGSPPSEPLNENRTLAMYGRVEGHYEELLTVGGAAYHNVRTFGVLPDRLDERYLGFAADIVANYAGGWLRFDFVQRITDFPEVEAEPSRTSLGFSASLGYRIPCGIEPAYRLAFYDPTSSFDGVSDSLAAQFEANELLYHTIGISWVPPEQPVAAQLNYTHARENPDRSIRNDRVELLGRLVF